MDKQINYILGDTHKLTSFLHDEKLFKQFKLISNSYIFHVGDFGIGFGDVENSNNFELHKDRKVLNELNEFLIKNNNILYVNRGNHDNINWFKHKFKLSNIILIDDYEILNHNEYKILFIGGAISPDWWRKHRIQDFSWWKNEKVKELTIEELQKFTDIDIIISHEIPKSFSLMYPFIPTELNSLEKYTYEEIQKNKSYLDLVLETVHPKYWFAGHYHTSEYSKLNNTHFRILNINEFINLENFIYTTKNFK